MSEDEDDYMSDKFLNSQADVRPSLIQDRRKKRQIEVNEKQKEHIKRQRNEQLERTGANHKERLEESLKRPIEEGNKGFQLLAKMGYKPGEALGKASSDGSTSGIKEPIGINIKADRGGLGRETALRDLAEKRKQLHERYLQRMRKETESLTVEEYRRRATAKAEDRFLQTMLRKCQATCENLDLTVAKIDSPNISWFWPERVSNTSEEAEVQGNDPNSTRSVKAKIPVEVEEEEDEETVEYSTADKLEMLMSYMRTGYNYCLWCGVHYQDLEDIQANCPGTERDDH